MTVVGDEDDGTFVVVDGADQSFAGVHVEMVCRFVEDQHMRAIEGGEQKKQPGFFTAR